MRQHVDIGLLPIADMHAHISTSVCIRVHLRTCMHTLPHSCACFLWSCFYLLVSCCWTGLCLTLISQFWIPTLAYFWLRSACFPSTDFASYLTTLHSAYPFKILAGLDYDLDSYQHLRLSVLLLKSSCHSIVCQPPATQLSAPMLLGTLCLCNHIQRCSDQSYKKSPLISLASNQGTVHDKIISPNALYCVKWLVCEIRKEEDMEPV